MGIRLRASCCLKSREGPRPLLTRLLHRDRVAVVGVVVRLLPAVLVGQVEPAEAPLRRQVVGVVPLRPVTFGQRGEDQLGLVSLLGWMSFPFAVVPKAEPCTRTDSARTADDYTKEVAQKMFRRIHPQFPA